MAHTGGHTYWTVRIDTTDTDIDTDGETDTDTYSDTDTYGDTDCDTPRPGLSPGEVFHTRSSRAQQELSTEEWLQVSYLFSLVLKLISNYGNLVVEEV